MVSSKYIHLATVLAIYTGPIFGSEKTDLEFEKLLTTHKVTPSDEQSYCYTDENGKVQGSNVDLKVRIASVSKLITSLWALEQKGANYRYETKLFIKDKNLHLQGSFDPFMSNEKMLFLISQLNTLGYKHFDKITFDKNIQINPSAQIHANEYPLITRDTNKNNIKLYFNTASWSKVFKNEYDRVASMAKKDRFLKTVEFSATTIEFAEKNPLVSDPENVDKDVKVLTLTSPELYKYLKETNVKSNNYSSHTIFKDLGGADKAATFLSERFQLTEDVVKLYNGSGLPTVINGERLDNYANCTALTDLINELKKSAEKQNIKLEDIIAVPGSDAGTFRNRLNSSDLQNSFVAKTGTLLHTSTLAGALSTQKGVSFFGVFNQTTQIIGAKNVQNAMVKTLLEELGGPLIFDYKVESFHAYNKEENVKSFNVFDEEEATDFSAIENDLY